MTKVNDELDKFGKRALTPLRNTPDLDQAASAEMKKQYLMQAENLHQSPPFRTDNASQEAARRGQNFLGILLPKPMMKALFAVFIVIAVLLVSTSFTVFAAQDSLPGETLYPVKSWSEDVRLSLTSSPQAKLTLILAYTNRRIGEISTLDAKGKLINEMTSERYQAELEDALNLAAQLDDTQIQNALLAIKTHAVNQGRTMQELISNLTPQAKPAMIHLQERLNEQVQLSTVGAEDPKAFRLQVQHRLQRHQPTMEPSEIEVQTSTPSHMIETPRPGQDNNNHGNGGNQPTEAPGNGGPGNENHGHNPTHTPKP
jgi:hypothetical protein